MQLQRIEEIDIAAKILEERTKALNWIVKYRKEDEDLVIIKESGVIRHGN